MFNIRKTGLERHEAEVGDVKMYIFGWTIPLRPRYFIYGVLLSLAHIFQSTPLAVSVDGHFHNVLCVLNSFCTCSVIHTDGTNCLDVTLLKCGGLKTNCPWDSVERIVWALVYCARQENVLQYNILTWDPFQTDSSYK